MAHINFINSYSDFLSLPDNTKDMEFQTGLDDNHAWKLHIFLSPDTTTSSQTAKNTADFLIKNNVSFKMGNGGDDGKVFTVYVGDYDKASEIATALNNNFGTQYFKNYPLGGAQTPEDRKPYNNIGMRFEGVNSKSDDSLFAYYGHRGIPALQYNLSFAGIQNWQLSALACHIFLAEKCGDKYLGTSYRSHPWANQAFSDLSQKFSMQQINAYVSDALKLMRATHQEKFIYAKNLVPAERAVHLGVNDIITPKKQTAQQAVLDSIWKKIKGNQR